MKSEKYCCMSFEEAVDMKHFIKKTPSWEIARMGFYIDYCPFCGQKLEEEL